MDPIDSRIDPRIRGQLSHDNWRPIMHRGRCSTTHLAQTRCRFVGLRKSVSQQPNLVPHDAWTGNIRSHASEKSVMTLAILGTTFDPPRRSARRSKPPPSSHRPKGSQNAMATPQGKPHNETAFQSMQDAWTVYDTFAIEKNRIEKNRIEKKTKPTPTRTSITAQWGHLRSIL